MSDSDRPEAALTSFVSNLTYDDLPDEVGRFVENRFIDTIGVMIAGGTTDPGKTVTGLASVDDDAALPPLWTADTGFFLGVLGHTLDFDDSTHKMHAHLSVTIVPTILALSTDRSVTGRDAVTGYAAGYETAYYLAGLVMDDHYEKGWHATATLGVYASTACACKILDLDDSQIRNALNIASSMPAGSRVNFGTWMKPIHAGHAVRSGLTAALLSSIGCTASESVISGRYGFVELYDGLDDWESRELLSLGEEWGILLEGVNTKKYPCCHATHAAIETTIDLMATHNIPVEEIENVEIVTSEFPSHNLHYDDPNSGLEGKFSMHYAVACAAANGTVDLSMFDDDAIDDPAVQDVREKVTHSIDDTYPSNNKTTVMITTVDGDTVEHTLDAPPGIQTDDELVEKFKMCTGDMNEDDRGVLFETVNRLRTHDDVSDLLEYVSV